MLQGIMDFTTPVGSSSGKALHLVATADIEDMTGYTVTMYNNGSSSAGNSIALSGSASAGDNILIYRDLAALDAYMDASNLFQVLIDGSSDQVPNGNGDDTVALSLYGEVIDTYGEIGVDGDDGWTGFSMYEDSWAYLVDGEWTAAPENSSDDTETTCDSEYPYPFADCGPLYDLTAAGGWRYQYEVAGYRGVGPGSQMFAEWWNAAAYEDFNNAAFPNPSGVNNGMVDDIMFFTADGGFTYDTGEDGTIMGKKPEIDAAFDPDGTN